MILGILFSALPLPAQELPGSYLERALLAEVHAGRGELDQAIAVYRSTLELAPASPNFALQVALLQARRGDIGSSFAWLDRAVERGFSDAAYLEWAPELVPLREIDYFADVLAACRAVPREEPAQIELANLQGARIQALSPDGERMVIDRFGRDVYLLDVESGEVIARLPDGGKMFSSIEFEPSGSFLVSSDRERGILLWGARDGRYVERLDAGSPHHGGLQFDAAASFVLCNTDVGPRAWRFPSGETIELPDSERASNVVLDSSGRWLIAAWAGRVWRIDTPSGAMTWETDLSDDLFESASLSSDARRVVLVGSSGAFLLDTEDGRVLRRHERGWDDAVVDARFDPRTDELVLYTYDGTIGWWPDGSDTPRRELMDVGDRLMASLEFLEGGDVLVLSRESSPLRAIDSSTGALLWERFWDGIWAWWSEIVDPSDWIVANDDDGAIVWLDPRTGDVQRRIVPGSLPVERPIPLPDGKRACVCTEDGSVRVFDLATGRGERRGWIHSPDAWIEGIGGAGRWIVTSDGATVRVWDLESATGAPFLSVPGSSAGPSPLDHRLFVLRDDHAVLVSCEDGAELLRLPGEGRELASPVWSPDGRRVACVVHSRFVQVWDASSGARVQKRLEHDEEISSLQFHPNSTWLATAEHGGRIAVWDIESGAAIHRLQTDDQPLADARFSPDGRTLFVSTNAIRAHDLQTSELSWQREIAPYLLFRPEMAPGSQRVYLSAASLHHIPDLDEAPQALVCEAGEPDRVLPLLGLHHVTPTVDEERLVAHWRESTVVLDGNTLEHRLTRIEYPDDGELISVPALYFHGTRGAWRSARLMFGEEARPLDGYASVLFDPRRVAAAAAGVALAPRELPDPPVIVAHEPADEIVAVEGRVATLRALAEDRRGLVGFQIEVDGRTLPWELPGKDVRLEDEGRRAELVFELERLPSGKASVRVRAAGRSGVLSRPWRLSLRWSP